MDRNKTIVNEFMRTNFSQELTSDEAIAFIKTFPVPSTVNLMLGAYSIYVGYAELTPYEALRKVILSFVDALGSLAEKYNNENF